MKKIIQINEQGMFRNHGTILECLCTEHLYEFEYLNWGINDSRTLYIKFWGEEFRNAKWGRLRWAWSILTRGYSPQSSVELAECDIEPFIEAMRNAYEYERDEQ